MIPPDEAARGMLQRYRTVARAVEMANLHLCDNIDYVPGEGNRHNPVAIAYWEAVIAKLEGTKS